jgi:hypothetical protein
VGSYARFNGGPLDGHQRPFPDASLPFFGHRDDDDPPYVHQHVYKLDDSGLQYEYMGYVTPPYRPDRDVPSGDDDRVSTKG